MVCHVLEHRECVFYLFWSRRRRTKLHLRLFLQVLGKCSSHLSFRNLRSAIQIFEMFEEVSAGVWRLNLWMNVSGKMIPVHVYLVKDNGWHLIDTGQYEDFATLAKSLDGILNGDELSAVYITHGHLDHAGGLKPLLEKYPQAVAYMHENERNYIVGKDKFCWSCSDEACTCFNLLKCFLREFKVDHRPCDISHVRPAFFVYMWWLCRIALLNCSSLSFVHIAGCCLASPC